MTHYLDRHQWETVDIHKDTAIQEILAISKRDFDVVLNMCDGPWADARPGIEVVQALEFFNMPYTGANAGFFEPTREMMKRACRFWGVGTPAGITVSELDTLEAATADLRYPLIVKHPNSYSSIMLTPASRVTNLADLRIQADRIIQAFGSALIEEFIDGSEFAVLVAENPEDPFNPKAYTPIVYTFPPGETFKHENLKWVNYAQMQCKAVEDEALAARLQDISKKLFMGLNGTGYGRCDIRMNEQGELFILEINPNCAIFYPPSAPGTADYILQLEPEGHHSFVEQILAAALARHARRQQTTDVQFHPETGYGLYAQTALQPSDMILDFEEQPRRLVSRSHVLKTWSAEYIEQFCRHAFPLTSETWVLWDKDPAQWKPINHACDPNTWLDGLNIVARRPIAPGEQITLDYATLYADGMIPFQCQCGSSNCRGQIQETDYLQPFVANYGEHISEYIKSVRKQGAS